MKVMRVPDNRRMKFLPNHFGNSMMKVEGRVFDYARRALPSYTGGCWNFMEADNGAGYMVPSTVILSDDEAKGIRERGKLRWIPSDISDGHCDLSPDAAGLALTILAVNHEWQRDPENDTLGVQWEKLMDVAYEHPEYSSALYGILD